MTIELADYANELLQQTLALRDERDLLAREAFTRVVTDILSDANETANVELAYHKAHGVEIDAWAMTDDDTVAQLFVADRRASNDGVESLTNTQVTTWVRRLEAFARRSISDDFADFVDQSDPVWEIADRLRQQRGNLRRIDLFVITDANARNPKTPEPRDISGIPVRAHVWDLERLHRLTSSGRSHEPIIVDLAHHGGPLPAVTIPGEPPVHLLAIPGNVLADLYDMHGARLLERNVRSFLQTRGAVNKGIRDTIRSEPGRFLAYNNGISATASTVRTAELPDGRNAITVIEDLQIVNGGQTTASLHNAKVRDHADLAQIMVQTKLTVVNDGDIDDIVTAISRYANTQNKVTAADLSANHPYHVRLEQLSRTVWAPAAAGTQRQTRWFYERARGQYVDATGRAGNRSAQERFKILNPTSQRFTKTDHAKYENAWAGLPHVVCLGAEKNFGQFMERVDADRTEPDDAHFAAAVARAILFRATEKVFSSAGLQGYRANVVAYTVALFAARTGGSYDLGKLWRQQGVDDATRDALAQIVGPVHHIVTNPTGTVRHIGEWTKKDTCWEAIQGLDLEPGADVRHRG